MRPVAAYQPGNVHCRHCRCPLAPGLVREPDPFHSLHPPRPTSTRPSTNSWKSEEKNIKNKIPQSKASLSPSRLPTTPTNHRPKPPATPSASAKRNEPQLPPEQQKPRRTQSAKENGKDHIRPDAHPLLQRAFVVRHDDQPLRLLLPRFLFPFPFPAGGVCRRCRR